MSDARLEDRGRAGHPGADAGLEVATDALGDGGRTTIGLEAVEIEPEVLGPLPKVRVIDVGAILVERIDQLEEAALKAGCLGSCMQGR